MDVKVLKDDNTEVELVETIDYGDTDLRSVIEGDRKYNNHEEDSLGSYGYSQQEFEGEELVDVEEESSDDGFYDMEETFDEE